MPSLYFKMPSVCPSVSATFSASINPLPSDRLRCCDRYIRCQRSLAVKPLTMSWSPTLRLTGEVCVESAGLRLPMYRYQTAAARCARWQLSNWCRRAETTAARRAATAAARPMTAFSTGVPVDCWLSYTTGHAAKRDCGLYKLNVEASSLFTHVHIKRSNCIYVSWLNAPFARLRLSSFPTVGFPMPMSDIT